MTRPFATIEFVRLALDHAEVRGLDDRGLHRRGVKLAIGLGARPADRRTLAAIEHAELDAAGIRDAAHQAVQRIDLADQMALAKAADRGIAGHRADGRKTVRHQGRTGAHPRSRARSLAAGVAAADDDHVERFSALRSCRDFYRGDGKSRKQNLRGVDVRVKRGCFT